MRSRCRGARCVRVVGALVSLTGLGVLVLGIVGPVPEARAELRSPSASDPRATVVLGNVTTCAAAGFGSSIQMGSGSNTNAADVNVAGVVATNAGSTQPGVGQEVNITITGANIAIDAVIVKGGPAYNRYTNPAVLPPALGSPQHYISPFNGGGNVPTISHWFVCYHFATPPPSGTFGVTKIVIAPTGIPVTPLPSAYTAVVNCNDGVPAHQNVTVTFGAGGGLGSPTLTGLAPGTICTTVEQNTGTFPPGTVVTFTPVGADTTGVTIPSTGAASATITNDFTATPVQSGSLQVVKTVVAPPGVDVPATFNAAVVCDDGTSVTVVLPGSGGVGTPTVSAHAGSLCNVEETTALPAGWTTTYSVGGLPPSTTSPTVPIVSGQTISITITNDGTDATTTSTSTTTSTTTTSTSTTTTTVPETTTSTSTSTSTTTSTTTTTSTSTTTTSTSTTTTTVPETTTTTVPGTSTTTFPASTTTIPTIPTSTTTATVGPESVTSTTAVAPNSAGTATTTPIIGVTSTGSGELPHTGGSSGPIAAGLALLVLGCGILAASAGRRRI